MKWKADLLERGREDPVWWIQTILGDSLWDRQQEISQALVHHQRVAVPASFGVGKTFLAARIALWWLFTHKHAKVITTAPTGRQVKDLLWSELRTAHANAKFPLGGTALTLSLTLAPDQFAVGFSTDDTNMDMFTGYHSPNMLVIFDQAGGLAPNVWKATEGLMTSKNCRWLAISNTAISDCIFADICLPDRSHSHGEWKIIPIDAENSPNIKAGANIYPGIISVEWLEEKKRIWDADDPLYKIFVKAEFVPNSQMNLIGSAHLQKCYQEEGFLDKEEGIDIGLDVARSGVDSTVWVARSGSRALEIRRVTGNDTMRTVQETIDFKLLLEEKYGLPIRFIKVDVIGVGAGVYDRLLELDMPVLAVNNAESAIEGERFANTRAEMGWALRQRFERGDIGLAIIKKEFSDLFNLFRVDISATKYKITQNGRIILWAKEELKKEIGRSPDYYDAMVMAFEDPKGGVPSIEFVSSENKSIIYTKPTTEEEWKKLRGQVVDMEEDFPDEFGID